MPTSTDIESGSNFNFTEIAKGKTTTFANFLCAYSHYYWFSYSSLEQNANDYSQWTVLEVNNEQKYYSLFEFF